jgi:hypothetical protein
LVKSGDGLIVGFSNDGVDRGKWETFNDRFDEGWHFCCDCWVGKTGVVARVDGWRDRVLSPGV